MLAACSLASGLDGSFRCRPLLVGCSRSVCRGATLGRALIEASGTVQMGTSSMTQKPHREGEVFFALGELADGFLTQHLANRTLFQSRDMM